MRSTNPLIELCQTEMHRFLLGELVWRVNQGASTPSDTKEADSIGILDAILKQCLVQVAARYIS